MDENPYQAGTSKTRHVTFIRIRVDVHDKQYDTR